MTDERIVAYLLNELPEEESERFEDECFAGESWPDQIASVEEDLIDAYLRGELTPEQRQRFERNYLTTEVRRERVALAAALLRHVDTLPAGDFAFVPTRPIKPTWHEGLTAFWDSQNWWLRAGVAVGVIAIIAGAFWFSRFGTPPPQTFATVTLNISAGNTRSAEGAKASRVRLPPSVDALKISLNLPEQPRPVARYRVELLELNEGGEVRPVSVTGQEEEFVSVEIPVAHLKRGQYALRLIAVRPDGTEQRASGSYFFIVE
jgi:hypothetical protein